jgi:hypothetical protein
MSEDDKNLEPVAIVYLEGGPCDGMEIRWPKHGIDFPGYLVFGVYNAVDCETAEELIRTPRKVRMHKYAALDCWTAGEVLEDGLPQEEHQSYMYDGYIDQDEKSIDDLWKST